MSKNALHKVLRRWPSLLLLSASPHSLEVAR